MKTKNTCHICDAEISNVGKKNSFALLECNSCGLIVVSPFPDKDYLSKEVYSVKSGYQKSKNKNLEDLSYNAQYEKIIKYIKKQKDKGKLLDIGCSSGELMYIAEKAGFNTTGVELNDRTASIARSNGLDVHTGCVEDIDFKDELFDIVFLGDVIEHVPDPKSLISQCSQLLKGDGLIVIVTPNMSCFWAKITKKYYKWFGIPWSVATPPHHIYQFNDKNLDMLMSSYDSVLMLRWYNHLPRLMYEIGQTHLWGTYKRNKSFENMLKMVLGFSLYVITFLVNKITKKLPKKDFGMVSIYVKK